MLDLHFTRTNGPVDDAIEQLMKLVGGVHRPEIVRELILASLKAGQEDDQKADLKLMNTSLKEMRFTSKVFGPYRDVKKVTVFGSARTKPDEPMYAVAREFGQKLAFWFFLGQSELGFGLSADKCFTTVWSTTILLISGAVFDPQNLAELWSRSLSCRASGDRTECGQSVVKVWSKCGRSVVKAIFLAQRKTLKISLSPSRHPASVELAGGTGCLTI